MCGALVRLSASSRELCAGALVCAVLVSGCAANGEVERRARAASHESGASHDRVTAVHLQVLGKAENAEQAIENANLGTTRVIERLRALGVAEEDLIATSFALDAGYRARSLLELTIRDSARANELIGAAERAGARVVKSGPGTLP
jgi:uncharacterized protein YggE